MHRSRSLIAPIAVLIIALTACGSSDRKSAATADAAPVTVRLGYFPNITHASAITGVEKGFFAQALGTDKLQTSTFNAGPAAVEALFAEAIDAAYLGPNPAINAYAKSQGAAIRIISGATSGGASLVVKPEIDGPAALKGKKVASPQLGGTQDVALRNWLASNGLKTDPQGGGDVSIVPQENAQTLETFRSGNIDGAWVPEPWATRLVQEGGGKVLVDERTLWPEGTFVTTHLVVRTKFLRQHPDAVRRLLEGQVKANDFVNKNTADAQTAVNAGIEKITGKKLSAAVIQAAWPNMTFTNDPIASSLRASADHAKTVGLLDAVNLTGIYDLKLLNEVLRSANEGQVKA
jgi:NitT/TauT family transport system substrate-binding protein